jgi:hypothetical protein
MNVARIFAGSLLALALAGCGKPQGRRVDLSIVRTAR